MPSNDYPNCSDKTIDRLQARQLDIINEEFGEFEHWMKTKGKNPDLKLGLEEETAHNYRMRIDRFFRQLWKKNQRFISRVDHEQAEAHIRGMRDGSITKSDGDTYAGNTIRKLVDALKKYFLWRAHEYGGEKWEPNYSINEQPEKKYDPFNKRERELLLDASLTYGSLPSYKSVSPDERDRLKGLLAQTIGKSKDNITPEDWKEYNRKWKIASLIHTAFDTGLEPCEVAVLKVEWYDSEQGVLRIPKAQSSKERKMVDLALTRKTQQTLDRWIPQRNSLPKYDGRDELWLTREGTPYQSHSLNRLLRNLMEEVDISEEGRRLCWMSIRHTVATYFANEGSVAQAQAQLRHQSPSTTMGYTHPTPEDRQDTLEDL